MAGYFFAHPDPVALIYWFADEVGPAVRKALELHERGLATERCGGSRRAPQPTEGREGH